jgi:hypothetical protein
MWRRIQEEQLRSAREKDLPQRAVALRQRLFEKAVEHELEFAQAAQHGRGNEAGERAVSALQRAVLEYLRRRAVEGMTFAQHRHEKSHGGFARGDARRRWRSRRLLLAMGRAR